MTPTNVSMFRAQCLFSNGKNRNFLCVTTYIFQSIEIKEMIQPKDNQIFDVCKEARQEKKLNTASTIQMTLNNKRYEKCNALF